MVDWGGNYPPGAKNDPKAPYNQPDHSHEHRWRPVADDLHPIIEDGAAIFHESCEYAEGRHGEGWSCEKERSYRFEYSHLILGDGTRIELPEITEWDEADDMEAEMVEYIEEAYHSGDADINVCPARGYGEVVISAYQWELHYEP